MEINTIFNNSALDSVRRKLADNPKVLKIAAKEFDKASGSTQDRLLLALDVAINSLKENVEALIIPPDLQEKSCAWLRNFSDENKISYYSSDRKADLINHIIFEASNRKIFS
jgi:hypothetical protein